MAFDLSTATPVKEDSEGQLTQSGKFDIASAKPFEDVGGTHFEKFQKDELALPPLHERLLGRAEAGVSGLMDSIEAFREPYVESVVGAATKPFGYSPDVTKPFGITKGPASPETKEAMAKSEKEHPIAFTVGQIAGGMAPFIATAPLFPETLLGTSAQFATVSGISEYGRQKVEDSLMKPPAEKVAGIGKETLKGALLGPVWHYAGELKFVGRPVASALAKAGVIGLGSATMEKVFGNDLTSAFKQGGTMAALSLMFEIPHLRYSVLGKGTAENSNVRAEEKGHPKIDLVTTDDQVFKQSVLDHTKAMAKEIKGKPKEIEPIKLVDGDKDIIYDIYNKIESGEAGKRSIYRDPDLPVGDDVFRTDSKSSFPKYFQNKGYTKENTLKILDKVLNGKELTTKQRKIYDDLFAHGKAEYEHVVESKRLKEEGISQSEIDEANRIGEEQAQVEFNFGENAKGVEQFLTPPKLPEITNKATIDLSSQSGQMDLKMIPGFVEISEALQKAHDEYVKTLVPPEVGAEAKYSSQILREQLGIQARANDRLNDILKASREKFEKATIESNLDFIDKMESGTAQDLTEHQVIANTLRDLYDKKWAEVVDTGKASADNFIENYFSHIWENPGKIGQVLKQFTGKKPLYGKKSFLKKRVIPTIKEGIELGFTPVTYNPIDLTMLKIREMDRFLAAHRSREAIRTQGVEKFVKVGGEKPEGWVKIKDPSSDVYSKNEGGELVLRGSYYTQPDVARLFDNHLSPGLRGNWVYDIYRGAGNTLNQFQLGLSAFHLGFTSMDATVSKFALGINKLATGNVAGAAAEFAKSPFAPVTNFMQGRELNRAWHGEDRGPLMNTIADAMATAGGRAKMDNFYATEGSKAITKALKEGKIVSAAFKVPWAIIEKMSKPIMEYIVPRQKMGIFADLMKFEIERNPNMSHAELRDKAQKAWDSVDNRMGQMVYDNLFWNKVVKDMGMASVRSLGWNLGTIRELGGAGKDTVKMISDMAHGKKPQVSYRMAYAMALPIVAGVYGAIYQYLHTGKGPEELKDYYFPKTGALDKKGQPARSSLPTYMKDVYHYTTNPVQTVLNKFSPVNNAVVQMLANKDFYGVEIRNVDDPAMQQVLDEVKFMGTQFIPFGIRNLNRSTSKTVESKIEPFIGITPAPYDVNMTKAEKAAYEMAKAKIPVGARTKEQAKHSQEKAEIRNEYMESKDVKVLNQALKDGKISSRERTEIIKQSKMTQLERLTEHLSFEEVASLMEKATSEEKKELQKIIKRKRGNIGAVSLERRARIDELYKKTISDDEEEDDED